MLKRTPPAWLCALGAVVFVLAFYALAYRTPLQDVWLAPNMDNDEVIYNRQVVSVITSGGPQGYFGYDETHAALGRYGTWGPLLIWMYALPGFLFGAGVNTVFWCNLLFTAVGVAVFARAARLRVWQALVFAGTMFCLWSPLSAAFSGGSEPLHYALTFTAVPAGGWPQRWRPARWKRSAAPMRCCFLPSRWRRPGTINAAGCCASAWRPPVLQRRCFP